MHIYPNTVMPSCQQRPPVHVSKEIFISEDVAAERYLDLLTLLPYPPAVLEHSHWVLIHLVVSLVP